MRVSLVVLVAAACMAGAVVGEAKNKKEAKGGLRYSVTVTKFKNEAGWRGQWDVGDGFSTIMTDVLNQNGHFIVLGDSGMRDAALTEQDFATTGRVAGGKKAPKMGRMTPAQLLVRGSVTHVQVTGGGKGKLHFKGISFGGKKAKAEVDITIYLVDSTTGQVLASKKVTGSSSERGIGVGYYGSGLGGLTGDLSGFKKDNVGKACEHAVAKAVKFMEEQLDEIAWEGSVVLVRGSKIIINRGEREGVKVGMKFKVGEVEEIVDPDTGELLDSDMSEVGELVATKVKHKITYCKATEGADAIKKGMTVFADEDK
jgi:curli biogenesis system outer membrane secretion channel CsgG